MNSEVPEWQRNLLSKVDFGPVDTCWDWLGDLNKDGRPVHGSGRQGSTLVSRRIYFIFRGDLPTKVELHHKCLHPWCVNPWHLSPVTKEEHQDAHRRDKIIPKTCKKGHPLDRHNLAVYERPDGRLRIECKQCGRERTAAWNASKRST